MIFCVEDDPNIRELEVYTLKSTGFPALGLESGDELFKALETVLPQLIILDIMLPGEDGMAILKRLRRDKRTADIPVIMATAKGSEFDKALRTSLLSWLLPKVRSSTKYTGLTAVQTIILPNLSA